MRTGLAPDPPARGLQRIGVSLTHPQTKFDYLNDHIPYAMNLNFLLKFIKRNKFYTAINLVGLSLGIACWWLISIYVGNELNYDSYQQNRLRIYRLTTTIIVLSFFR